MCAAINAVNPRSSVLTVPTMAWQASLGADADLDADLDAELDAELNE